MTGGVLPRDVNGAPLLKVGDLPMLRLELRFDRDLRFAFPLYRISQAPDQLRLGPLRLLAPGLEVPL